MRSNSMPALTGAIVLLASCFTINAGEAGATVYRVTNLGDPGGGNVSQGTSDNQPGTIAGFSLLPDSTMNAELWNGGRAVSLGTLGGPNSAVAWPNRNDHGLVAGIAETARMQPLGEEWSCFAAVFFVADNHVCQGFVWRDGSMAALPTLGGDNGFATGINNRDEIVGWAENTTHDPTCDQYTNTHQVLQFEAVMWVRDRDDAAGNGYRAIELPPFAGDLDGAATAVNERGEVVGISGICDAAVGGGTAEHMILWDHGVVARNLPTLGGAFWNTPMDINNRGNIVGFSDLPGDGPTLAQANFHAFFWSDRPYTCNGAVVTGTCDLGTLAGDSVSEALGVNDRDQVVGVSFPSGHAFIWEDGHMTDLNSMLAPGTTLVLTDAQDINDRGEITGQAADPSTNTTVAFDAIPLY